MLVCAVSGSPRRGGNTDTLLEYILGIIGENGIETEFISLAGKTIKPCTACGGCKKEPRCIIDDDDFGPVFDSMMKADALIVGSPVYFNSATPEMSALLDRAGYVAKQNGGLFARKIGGPVAVARRAGHNFTYAQMLMWYMINGMVVPGSTYWNVALAAGKGEVTADAEAMQTAAGFAENIVWLLNATETG